MQPNDDVSVQIIAVGTTVFVLIFLYMAKKMRDRRRANDGFEMSGNYGSAIASNLGGEGNGSNNYRTRGWGELGSGASRGAGFSSNGDVDDDMDEDASPPRIHKHKALADVVELVIYPVKSCAGVSYDQLQLTKTGFWGDRLWMIVEPHPKPKSEASPASSKSINKTALWYRFVTQRECPRMALIQPKIQSTTVLASLSSEARADRANSRTGLLHGIKSVTMSAPGQRDILCPVIRAASPHAIACHVTMHDPGSDDADGVVDQGDEAAEWLSSFLGRPHLRLVFRDPATCKRAVTKKYSVPGQVDSLSLADGMQYLLASRTSLAELNRRMPEGSMICTMDRFRPNIVVNGSGPFDEDTWGEIKIGPNTERWSKAPTFFGVKHCTRCVMPTTDQQTGEQGGVFSEPLTTLRTFRRREDGKPIFGENLGHKEEWSNSVAPSVAVGDSVWLVSRKEPGWVGSTKKREPESRNGCIVC